MDQPNARTAEIITILAQTYPKAGCELNFSNPYQLLIATILSAQCTDIKVNAVTKSLFADYPSAQEIIKLSQTELENIIRPLGLFHNKARNILSTSQILLDRYQGEVPSDMASLVSLPGVGRKTANVILSNAFNFPALAVDTHVFRVSRRLDLTRGKTPHQVELDLTAQIPRDLWSKTHHLLIWHGRRICKAQKPACPSCPLLDLCPSAQ
ncbi:endonuclease III; DNA-(apurinic or apyrimidinic site) lyase [Syntrophobotulus glycolicus DSM 8271]|uniref:Endonuclease III n=1 Tax=Syntrophobotulus glycolicus (strain DSM 8271 / FlGlyR) TaxID=645991 RepID=F0T0X5_SYNGF|nr:endonuclease III [Syntrophobotulus glycolicus]ADY56264.1 endonuclease III; DNA-(apurinic or apyrimidinic site) lyase [Syntrophobotulus glycolicus DSM 8271]